MPRLRFIQTITHGVPIRLRSREVVPHSMRRGLGRPTFIPASYSGLTAIPSSVMIHVAQDVTAASSQHPKVCAAGILITRAAAER